MSDGKPDNRQGDNPAAELASASPQARFDELQAWLDAGKPPLEGAPSGADAKQGDCTHPLASDIEGTLGARQVGPVILQTGQLHYREDLIELPGGLPLRLRLRYLGGKEEPDGAGRPGPIGHDWRLVGYGRLRQQGDDPLHADYRLQLDDGRVFHLPYDPEEQRWRDPGNLGVRVEPLLHHQAIALHYRDGRSVYYRHGRYIGELDRNGNRIDLHHDALGRPQALTNSGGARLDFHYPDDHSPVATIRDHGNREWRLEHDDQGRLLAIHTPAGGARHYRYDPEGRLTAIHDSLGRPRLEVRYHPDGRVEGTRERGIGDFTRYHPAAPRQIAVTEPGRETRYHLDRCGLIDSILYPNGANAWQRWRPDTRRGEREQGGRKETEYYDDRRRLIRHIDVRGRETVYRYPGDLPEPVEIDAPTGVTRHRYDARGNRIATTDEKGRTEHFAYDDSGNLVQYTDAGGHTTRIQYSRAGQPLLVTDPAGHRTELAYDPLGRQIAHADPDGHQVQYQHDPEDRLTRLIDPNGRAIGFQRDPEGQLQALTDPAGQRTGYTYDDSGRVTRVQHPDGRQTRYHYDEAHNRPTRVERPDGSRIDIAYDIASDPGGEQPVRVAWHPAEGAPDDAANTPVTSHYRYQDGHLVDARNEHGRIQLDWDDQGRLQTQIQHGITIEAAHHPDHDQRVTLSFLGHHIHYQRDRQGLLTGVQIDDQTLIQQRHDSADRLIERRYPNRQGERHQYDDAGRLADLRTADQHLPYQYDPAGQIVRKGDLDYRYDPAGQLIQAGPTRFHYDPAGNRLRVTDAADPQRDEPTPARHDPRNNRRLEDHAHHYRYDARGNLQSKTHKASGATQHYSFDLRDQLIAVHGTAWDPARQRIVPVDLRFTYDALGRRIEKIDNGQRRRYLHDRLDLIAIATDRPEGGQRLAIIVHDDTLDTPLAIHNDHGTFYYHRDHQGSILGLSDGQGRLVERFEYDGHYGAITRHHQQIETDNPFAYTGREHDRDDLYYYRARYYDPGQGRFLSEDPIGFLAGDWNLYRYVGDDPVDWADPFGLSRSLCNRIRSQLKKAEAKATRALTTLKAFKKLAAKKALKKAATIWTRGIPVLGWAMAAYDVYDVATTGYDIYKALDKYNALADEIEGLAAELADCEKKSAAKKGKKGGKVKGKKNKKCKANGRGANHNKGKCAEKLVRDYYAAKSGHRVLDESLHTTPNGVQGLDHVVVAGNTAIIIETKANTARHSKSQKYGNVYKDKQLGDMREGVTEGEGRYKNMDPDKYEELQDELKDKKFAYRKCRVKLKNDKTNCYGAMGRGRCKAVSAPQCSEWETRKET